MLTLRATRPLRRKLKYIASLPFNTQTAVLLITRTVQNVGSGPVHTTLKLRNKNKIKGTAHSSGLYVASTHIHKVILIYIPLHPHFIHSLDFQHQ